MWKCFPPQQRKVEEWMTKEAMQRVAAAVAVDARRAVRRCLSGELAEFAPQCCYYCAVEQTAAAAGQVGVDDTKYSAQLALEPLDDAAAAAAADDTKGQVTTTSSQQLRATHTAAAAEGGVGSESKRKKTDAAAAAEEDVGCVAGPQAVQWETRQEGDGDRPQWSSGGSAGSDDSDEDDSLPLLLLP